MADEIARLIKKRLISIPRRWRSLIGKQVGDLATAQSPAGVREYEVQELSFEEPEGDVAT